MLVKSYENEELRRELAGHDSEWEAEKLAEMAAAEDYRYWADRKKESIENDNGLCSLRGGAGRVFTLGPRRYSGPGSTLCPSSTPRMTRGPGRAVGRGGYFTFPADCLDGSRLLGPHSCPCAGPHLFLRVIFSD